MRHAAKLSETLSSINQAIWVAHSYKQEYKSAHRTASSYAVPGSTRYRQNASPHHHHHHLDHHTTRTDVVCSSTPWTRSVCSFCYCRVRPDAASQLTISRGLAACSAAAAAAAAAAALYCCSKGEDKFQPKFVRSCWTVGFLCGSRPLSLLPPHAESCR